MLNLTEGVLRLALFIAYIFAISKMEDIHRVFQYHGAEHKSIYCYENGEDLSIENVKIFDTPSKMWYKFSFIVMMISMVLFSMVA